MCIRREWCPELPHSAYRAYRPGMTYAPGVSHKTRPPTDAGHPPLPPRSVHDEYSEEMVAQRAGTRRRTGE